MIVLVSNVVSELLLVLPNPQVLQWIEKQSPSALHTTSVTEAELRLGAVVQHSFCNFPDDCTLRCKAQWSEAKRSFAAQRAPSRRGFELAVIALIQKESSHYESHC